MISCKVWPLLVLSPNSCDFLTTLMLHDYSLFIIHCLYLCFILCHDEQYCYVLTYENIMSIRVFMGGIE